MARLLFEGIPFVKYKYSNLRTASSEIDLVFSYTGCEEWTIFDYLGPYFLVECKNWKEPVGAKHVRDFIQKMQKSQVKLGVLVAPQGVTGAHGGADALREIHYTFDRWGLYLIVVALDDLLEIEKGGNFYELVERQVDRLRFDFIWYM